MMKQQQTFDIRYPVALGSGLASALLLVALRQGTLPALFLAYLSPLPLMIATLGFGHATGLGAVAVSVLTFIALMTATTPQDLSLDALLTAGLGGLIFAVCEALPAWWLARLAGLSRAAVGLPWTARAEEKGRAWEYYPLGIVVLNAAAIGFSVVAVATVTASLFQTSFAAGIDKAAAKIAPLIVQALGPYELPSNIDLVELSRLVVKAMPPVAACMIFLLLLLNLWLAGRIVQVSNRLARPWPNIAHDLRVPRLLGLALAAAFGLCFLGALVGLVASIATAILGVVFALQGLAVIHDLSRGAKFRSALLCMLYVSLGLLMPWPLVVFVLVGLAEAGFSLRDRKAAATASPHV
jgi:hypothetical protein